MSIRSWAFAGALIAGLASAALACGGDAGGKPPMTPESNDPPTAPESTDGGASGGSAADGGEPGATAAEPGDAEKAPTAGDDEKKPAEDGAHNVLKQFVADGADHVTLTKALRPTTADYKALFDAATAAKVEAQQSKDWDSGKAVIKPKPGQTELKVWSASGADIAAGKGDAKEFPEGYKKIGKHLAKDATFYRFKFVEPGKDTGTAYDGLAFVNAHWVIVPKPWRALDGKASAKDEDAAPARPAKGGAKPKPKPKKKK